MAGGRCVALILVSMSLKLFGENQFGLPEVSAARIVERAEDGNQPPARTVRLMTGSDDTVLDDVSVRLTPSLMMFPLT